jgi:flagellar biosynthesis protein FlhF
MHVKRVYRPTVREALAEARQQLGPGALVLSTELVPAAGWRGWLGQRVVRLTAAADRSTPEPAVELVSAPRPALSEPRHMDPASAARAGVVARLAAVGLDPVLCAAVAGRLSESECRHATEESLRQAVIAELETAAAADEDYARCEVFVGPPGVGKTTTIAKIAAQERATHGRTMALVAADAFRAGAIEQLRSYAAIVQSPFRVARSADELDSALGAARHPALVDTAGRSPKDDALTGLVDVLDRRRSVRTHLVLAADTSPASAARIFDRYAPLKPSRVVITKLDESDSLAPLLAVVRDRGLPVSYLTAGQRVPEDLWRATPASLAATLLGDAPMGAATCH